MSACFVSYSWVVWLVFFHAGCSLADDTSDATFTADQWNTDDSYDINDEVGNIIVRFIINHEADFYADSLSTNLI
jgi:hypothetical protein